MTTAPTITATDLRSRLDALSMSGADLARLAGRGASIVSLWLSGKSRVPAYVTKLLDLHAEVRALRAASIRRTALEEAWRRDGIMPQVGGGGGE